MTGFATAFGEITLVLFTTLAPSGAAAYLIMGLPVLTGRATGEDARRLNRLTCLPLLIAMAGLIASATHLGNPANALYVFTGAGRSPLSTEVCCAVAFLALAGIFWLYSFAEEPRRWLQRALLGAIDVAIVAFVAAVAYAYDVDTIITWSLPLVPVALVLNALVGGPLIALVGFAAARWAAPWRLLVALSAVAAVANAAVYVVLGGDLAPLANELASVTRLVPSYLAWVAAFAVLVFAGVAVAWRTGRHAAGGKEGAGQMGAAGPASAAPADIGTSAPATAKATAEVGTKATVEATDKVAVCFSRRAGRRVVAGYSTAALLALAGVFIMRFVFYMTHLTLGLGV
ncbi:DmsC/YnfH family molybdoenzyme membrane anchor subunit [Adlercreutzia sp. R25]|uniref:DmsC/YnfH family molybdoenzyme membrane anchor subunit n=1 Tax=Adlercreutzia shanghongiae TaxID=3111773 RepID=A0ABU6IZD4_9ACTN|nr:MULTISPECIES: DmsC/YnfH family molybdoenzyme membrane anchor subunit [unclassified Adlercreutzia]MEC4273009.1 DmsC/YnfH family molybdoenzyme membrane anchor subunit [Adlercreutzia sp. R25]MEC4295200.1 DmsC/YnfH family molybdoenzyme membrane anchor subunit [Adlercreutzia sp. R22]